MIEKLLLNLTLKKANNMINENELYYKDRITNRGEKCCFKHMNVEKYFRYKNNIGYRST